MMENKCRVCHITSAHNRYDTRIFHKMCKSLAENGYDTHLLCMDDKGEEFKDGVNIASVGYKPKNRLQRIFFSSEKLRTKAADIDADIYHIHDPELLFLGLKLKKLGKKVVFDSHEDYVECIRQKHWLPRFLRATASKFYENCEKRALKKYDAVITVSPHIEKRLEKISKNTVVVTNYPLFNGKSVDYTKNIGSSPRYVCFAGGISRQWMHQVVIEAVSEIDDVKYLLAGNCDDDYFEELKNVKGFDKVEYLGKISFEEVKSRVYDVSFAGIALNDYVANVGFKKGSLGNTKLFEYMASGLPVICTDFELWQDIISKEKIGYCVAPNDVSKVRDAIKALLNDEKSAREMSERAYAAAGRTYCWQSQFSRLDELYKTLA